MKLVVSALTGILLFGCAVGPDLTLREQAQAMCGGQYRIVDGEFISDFVSNIQNDNEMSPALKKYKVSLYKNCVKKVISSVNEGAW